MDKSFKALVVNKTDEEFSLQISDLALDDLHDGDVVIKVAYSSVNYKDGLASSPKGKIARNYPLIPGIDMAGIVVESKDPRFQAGDKVIATSYEIGVSHHGGYSEYARVKAEWIVPLPEELSLKEAMIYGTAGFTAALSVHRLEENGLHPEKGKVLVTGATGGVGSMAISILAKRGYEIIASTGKETAHSYLRELGAKEILSREDVFEENIKALDKQLWFAAVDPVGGKTLASVLSKTAYNGSVAVCGLTGGTDVPTTVYPFILRGINLLGIDSVYCPMELRKIIWQRMATEFKPDCLENIIDKEVTLEELSSSLSSILKSEARGRTIVKL